MQFIICVEADSASKSDYVYIKSALYYFYKVDNNKTKLSPIYMGGRENYSSNKIKRRIASLVSQYKVGSPQNESVVIYCFDCDQYTTDKADADFLDKAKRYCDERAYKFVWFCKEIESVFLGKQIADMLKKKEAERFALNRGVEKLNRANFSADKYKDKHSNLCKVLDEYFADIKNG